MIIFLHGHNEKQLGDVEEISKKTMPIQGTWSVIAVGNIKEALEELNTRGFSNGKIDNIILQTHGFHDEVGEWGGFTLRDNSLFFYKRPTIESGYFLSDDMATKSMAKLLSYISRGGNFVLGACGTGIGEKGKKLVNRLSYLAQHCINIYACGDGACGILGLGDDGGFTATTSFALKGGVPPSFLHQNTNGAIRYINKITTSATPGTAPIKFN